MWFYYPFLVNCDNYRGVRHTILNILSCNIFWYQFGVKKKNIWENNVLCLMVGQNVEIFVRNCWQNNPFLTYKYWVFFVRLTFVFYSLELMEKLEPRRKFEPPFRNCVLFYVSPTIWVKYKVSSIYFVTDWNIINS